MAPATAPAMAANMTCRSIRRTPSVVPAGAQHLLVRPRLQADRVGPGPRRFFPSGWARKPTGLWLWWRPFPETIVQGDFAAIAIRAVGWGENIHDRENATVRGIYPTGMHGAIAEALNEDPGIKATTATMDQPEHGLTEARLAEIDVMTWWGHRNHGGVDDKIVEKVAERVW